VHLAFVAAAVLEHSLERAPVRGFRAFAFFFEALEDLETFAAAVLFADSELCRQAEVFRLLFGIDAGWLQGQLFASTYSGCTKSFHGRSTSLSHTATAATLLYMLRRMRIRESFWLES